MPKLNETQSILLAAAAQRDSGSLYPMPGSLTFSPRVANAITKLLSSALVEERETSDMAAFHRTDGDLNFGLFITTAGVDVIGIEPEGDDGTKNFSDATSPASPQSTQLETKTAQILALLSRSGGATLAELIDATSWLPHTTRAALTGLRKKGHNIERTKSGGNTCYRVIAPAAAEAA
jgi:hypothetical protein